MDIQISKLVKDYGNHRVLDIQEFFIKKGSLLGIIGLNGAGKSTLIKIIGGLEEATAGQVYYNGKTVYPDLYKHMTIVFQKPYLFRTTVFNNIAYPLVLRKYHKKEIRKKVENLLEEMGLEDLQDKKSWTLSGGELQKVALARALIFKPSLLMLDEPTANIDPSSIAIMEKMIKKIHKEENTTVIIITHNLQQAKRLCNDVAFMHRGKIEEAGKMEEIIFHPKKQMTQAFVKGELLI